MRAAPSVLRLAGRGWSMACCHSGGSTRMKWFFSRCSRKGTPLPISVSNEDDARLGFLQRARRVEGGHHGGQVVAVDALHVPAEGGPLVGQRLEAQHLARGAVGLLVVDVDQADQVGEAVVGGAHRGLPGRAFVELAVGHRVVDEGRVALVPQRRAPCPPRSAGPGRASRRTSPCPACRWPCPTSAGGCRRCRRSRAPLRE